MEGKCHFASVGFRFFAVPNHRLVKHPELIPSDELVEPDLPNLHEAIERALTGVEYRDIRARDRLRMLLTSDTAPEFGAPGDQCGRSAIFAQSPNDLPALLRLADQLEKTAQAEAGERALVWRCAHCATRYAVPVALARSVSIACERCGQNVELDPHRAVGEESLLAPFQGAINTTRRQLANFFREAMARGWPVLVCSRDEAGAAQERL